MGLFIYYKWISLWIEEQIWKFYFRKKEVTFIYLGSIRISPVEMFKHLRSVAFTEAPKPYYSNGNSIWKFNDAGRSIRRRISSSDTTFRQVFSAWNILQTNNFNAQFYRNFWILQLDDWGKGDKEQCSLLLRIHHSMSGHKTASKNWHTADLFHPKQFLLFILHTKLSLFCLLVISRYQFRIHVHFWVTNSCIFHAWKNEIAQKVDKLWHFWLKQWICVNFFLLLNIWCQILLLFPSFRFFLLLKSYFNLFAECFLPVWKSNATEKLLKSFPSLFVSTIDASVRSNSQA